MSDIVEFLKARLDEDEKEARDAIAERESIDWPHPELSNRPDYGLDSWPDLSVPAVVIGPERLLREVKAKRRLLAMFPDPADGDGWNEAGSQVLEVLATAYADHPDYREEWRALIA